MDFEFRSQEELFNRVRPALHAKETELHRLGFLTITAVDVWKYLIKTKWTNARGLMLSDIVSDILNSNCKDINSFCNNKTVKEHIQEDREII